jgi:hypothetical protein
MVWGCLCVCCVDLIFHFQNYCNSYYLISINMFRRFVLACSVCLCATAQASDFYFVDDSAGVAGVRVTDSMLQPLVPTFLAGVTRTSPWSGHWFVTAGAGVNVFAGSPLGCGDLFDRMEPAAGFSVGKWFTPSIGGRIAFGGFRLKDGRLSSTDYQGVHADFLWNIVPYMYRGNGESRWGLSPYVGAGIIHNGSRGGHPFGVSYGLMGSCRLAERLHLNLELGGITTFGDFDGLGNSRELGDNVFSLTAGLSVTLGKTRWARVIDAGPYMAQNGWLLGRVADLEEQGRVLARRHERDSRVVDEMKKILEIEGLLRKYGGRLRGLDGDSMCVVSAYPYNDYSGYNSLMARLRNRRWDGISDSTAVGVNGDRGVGGGRMAPSDSALWNGYLLAMEQNRECIGAPVYFFFRLNTAELTDGSQSLNIDEMARIAKMYDLRIRISGAADRATGSSDINRKLSRERALFIGRAFRERGIEKRNIVMVGRGGIDEYDPDEVNRQTKVELFFEPRKRE